MYFEQFYLGCLSHASYMLASEDVAAVVDPQRDVGIYIERLGFWSGATGLACCACSSSAMPPRDTCNVACTRCCD